MLNNQVLISKNQIKFVRSLHDKKHRLEESLFIVEGEKIIAELLLSQSFSIHSLYITIEFKVSHTNELNKISEEKIHLISDKELTQISSLQTPNLALAIVHFAESKEIKIDSDKKYILLDNIKDPGNLGTIIRTADWFGINTIFCSAECVESTNPKVIQATMGSFLRVQIQQISLLDLFTKNKTMPVYGAVLDGENLYHSKFSKGAFLVIGSESHGISNEIREKLTHKIKIPNIGKAESLNASIATAIICSEWTRQCNFNIKEIK